MKLQPSFLLLSAVICWLIACNVPGWPTHQAGDVLFPIEENNRYGFINQNGEVVIKPVFRAIGNFVGGLAPARRDGTYGFINTRGEFAIPPMYDYAADFSEGFARVWADSEMFYVNTRNERLPNTPKGMINATDFSGGTALFRVQFGEKHRLYRIDSIGNLAEFEKEAPFVEGLRVVEQAVTKKGEAETEYAVEDSLGNLIVPYGLYSEIGEFKNGFAEVSIDHGEDDSQTGFINRKGKLVFTLPKGSHVFDNYFSEGLIAITTDPEPDDQTFSPSENYIVWYDTAGMVRWVKKSDQDACPFQNGRAFAGDIRNWYLMDHSGNQLGQHRFEWLFDGDNFDDNMFIVARKRDSGHFSVSDEYGVIDSMGNYLIPPRFNHVADAGFQQEGLLVAMDEAFRPEHDSPKYKPRKKYWGLIDRGGRYVFKPKFTTIDPSGFQNGLLFAEIDSLYGYVNNRGDYVWSAVRREKGRQYDTLNVDYMVRAYCYAFASDKGPTMVEVDSQRMSRTGAIALQLPSGEMSIRVDTSIASLFAGAYAGITAFVYNTTSDTVDISVQDNRLYIVTQALDEKGEWQDIEYAPSSWCGNSYYKIRLYPDEYWQLAIPRYTGDRKTLLRLAFTWRKAWENQMETRKTVYSNTFPGSVNPGQFWRKSGYEPSGFMDPYND